MTRREFMASIGAATVARADGGRGGASASAPRVLMKLGCQSAPTNLTHLQYLARYGVRNICGYPEIGEGRLYATVEETPTHARDGREDWNFN